MPNYASFIQIDLDNVALNYMSIKDYVNPSEVIPVLKGNAYGHGAIPLARILVEIGCKRIAVARICEAQELIEAGLDPNVIEIIVMSPLSPEEIRIAVKIGVSLFIGDFQSFDCFKKAISTISSSRLHIKVDTGLGRSGFLPSQAKEVKKLLSGLPDGVLSGIATHLSSPGEENGPNWLQKERFDSFISEAKIPSKVLTHLASSSAAAKFPELCYKGVRVGDLTYGLCSVTNPSLKLRPVLSFFTKVVGLKNIPSGWSIGYGGKYKTTKSLRVATVPIGITDGLTSAHAGKTFMLVKGKRCAILAIFADVSIIDIDHLDNVEMYDQVVFIGSQYGETITALEQARSAGIGFSELLSKISLRIPRIYTMKGKTVGEISLLETQGIADRTRKW